MVDRRIDGQPAVYVGPDPVIHENRTAYAQEPFTPPDGATFDTDPRICVVCGVCRRMTIPARDWDANDGASRKHFIGTFGDTCRACKEEVDEKRGRKQEPKPAKKRSKKSSRKDTDDGVPF